MQILIQTVASGKESWHICFFYFKCINVFLLPQHQNISMQSSAAEVCWAHNPEVDGSKPSSANVHILHSVP